MTQENIRKQEKILAWVFVIIQIIGSISLLIIYSVSISKEITQYNEVKSDGTDTLAVISHIDKSEGFNRAFITYTANEVSITTEYNVSDMFKAKMNKQLNITYSNKNPYVYTSSGHISQIAVNITFMLIPIIFLFLGWYVWAECIKSNKIVGTVN